MTLASDAMRHGDIRNALVALAGGWSRPAGLGRSACARLRARSASRRMLRTDASKPRREQGSAKRGAASSPPPTWPGSSAPNGSTAGAERICACRHPSRGIGWCIAKLSAVAPTRWCYGGRYLYRGVLPEHDILSDRDGLITFRICDNSGPE